MKKPQRKSTAHHAKKTHHKSSHSAKKKAAKKSSASTAKPKKPPKPASPKKAAAKKTPKASRGGTLARIVAQAPPEFVDLSTDPAMPRVWDQGDGSCIAHASMAAFMWAHARGEAMRVATVDPTAIQACLSAGYPVTAAVDLFESFDDAAVATYPLPDECELDSHYVLIVGIGHGHEWPEFQAKPDRRYVKVRNSWGAEVHRGGYVLLPLSYLHHHGSDFWTIRGEIQ